MTIKTWMAVSCATLTCSSAALARLGETSEQITARYGRVKSINEVENIVLYESDGFYVRVEFKDGKAGLMAYRKAQDDAISDTEIAAILKRHLKAGEWKALPGAPGWRLWESADGAQVARYSIVGNMLIVMVQTDDTRR